MADRKISDLTALTTPASGDYLPIVDISEAAAASKNKRITIEELMRGVPDGTAAAPGIAFETDPNTGIYRPGADQLAVATNGTGRLFVDANGNVGVGGAPSFIFDTTQSVAAGYSNWGFRNTAADGYIRQQFLIGPSGANGTASINYAPGIFFAIGPTTNDTTTPIVFRNNNAQERMRITAGGLVGIGTSSPAANLHVVNTTLINPSLTYNSAAGQIFRNQLSELAFGTMISAPYSAWIQARFSGNAGQNISLNPLGGNVGIGTSSVGARLHIRDGSNVNLYGAANGAAFQWTAVNDSASAYIDYIQNALTVQFQTGGSERARIDSSGRLLVGTSTGSAAVHIGNSVDSLIMDRVGDVAGASIAAFRKSRGVVGTPAIVSTEDTLGTLNYSGFDGSNYIIGARILAQVDGTPGVNDMPGRLVFSTTADGASSPTERMRIKSAGTINFSNVSTYADNTAALAGGLVAGDVYRKSDGTLMITY